MRHRCVSQTSTYEALAEWIKSNAAEVIQHVEKINLGEEETHELERQSSMASRAIDKLEELKKEFMDYIKEGTPGIDGELQPVGITIHPTKGLKALKANRAFADKQLDQGFKEEGIPVYIIPYPEYSLMVGVDIVGAEWPQYTKEMSIDQINQHKPILRVEKGEKKKKTSTSFMDEEDKATAPELDL
ncbi:MAG TPA: hypothetical protein VL443_24185 [Cyclobacteriaceae bacterium]|jgi:hypothetical protein|nr:hypothetical protein [Cyclobacteriaceae bacterium]